MTYTRTEEEVARDEFDAALYESPEAEAYFAAEAQAQQDADYAEWRAERLADDPHTPEEELTEEAYTDSLLASYASFYDLDI